MNLEASGVVVRDLDPFTFCQTQGDTGNYINSSPSRNGAPPWPGPKNTFEVGDGGRLSGQVSSEISRNDERGRLSSLLSVKKTCKPNSPVLKGDLAR